MSQFNKSRGVGFGRTVPTSNGRAGFALVTPVSRRESTRANQRELRELGIRREELGV
jgi:hypothetical protein